MSIAIITGSSGLIGSDAVNFFCEKGFDVIGIDNNFRKLFFGNEGSTLWIKNKNLRKNNGFLYSTPERTRTPNLLVRSQTLYPIELQAHIFTKPLSNLTI